MSDPVPIPEAPRARLFGWLGAALVGLLAALWLLYPAWLEPRHGVVGDWLHPDMISNHWLYRWMVEAVPAGESIVHNDRYYLPIGDGPWIAGNGSDALPFLLVGLWLPWPLSMTVWAGLIIVLNGLSGTALARACGARSPGALLVAAAAVSFSPYVAYELGCARYAQAPLYWMGFFLATWIRLLDAPTVRRGVLAGVLYSAAAFTYWYYGLWLALAGAALFAFRRQWRALVGFVPTALLLTVPPLAIFLHHWANIPGVAETEFPHPLAIKSGLFFAFPIWGASTPLQGEILPLSVVLLAGLGLWRWPGWRRRGLVVVALGAYLLALGPELLGPDGSSTGVPGPFGLVYGLAGMLKRFWWPYRHIAVLTLAIAPLAALGVERLSRRGRAFAVGVPAAVLLLLPLDVGLRGGTAAVVTSWFEEPSPYQAIRDMPGDALIELPLAAEIAGSQQSLSYQWVHKKKLVNGHAMWVERVRPDAWDAWVLDNTLLAGLQQAELGKLPEGVLTIDPADVNALSELGLRYIVLSSEYFPGELAKVLSIHNHILTTFFGEPVHAYRNVVVVWDLAQYTGSTRVVVSEFSVPTEYLAIDGMILPKEAVTSSLGWRPFARAFPPAPPQQPTETVAEPDAGMQDILRRKLRREREKERADMRAAGAGCDPEAGPCFETEPKGPEIEQGGPEIEQGGPEIEQGGPEIEPAGPAPDEGATAAPPPQ